MHINWRKAFDLLWQVRGVLSSVLSTTTPLWVSQMINQVDYGQSILKTLAHHLGACCYLTGNTAAAAAAAKLPQACRTLWDPIDGSPPGSPVPGILQARTLEWVAISFSDALKWKLKVKSLSRVPLFATPWTAAYQVPPPMGFSRQEYWSGSPSLDRQYSAY